MSEFVQICLDGQVDPKLLLNGKCLIRWDDLPPLKLQKRHVPSVNQVPFVTELNLMWTADSAIAVFTTSDPVSVACCEVQRDRMFLSHTILHE
jgi:hypothetical protein